MFSKLTDMFRYLAQKRGGEQELIDFKFQIFPRRETLFLPGKCKQIRWQVNKVFLENNLGKIGLLSLDVQSLHKALATSHLLLS